MKKPILSILFLLNLVFSAVAQDDPSLKDYLKYLSPQDLKTLETAGELNFAADKPENLRLWKGSPFSWVVNPSLGKDSTISVEGLFTFPLPQAADPGQRLLKLFNALNAVSSMEGTLYYSASRKQWETFILASYRVANQNQNAKLPDLSFTTLPMSQSLTVFQKDNKLGEGYSQMTIKVQNGGLLVEIRNLTGYSMGILPLVDPQQMVSYFYLVPLKDKMLLYGNLTVKTFSFFGLEKSKEDSFFNRMKALASWFKRQAQ